MRPGRQDARPGRPAGGVVWAPAARMDIVATEIDVEAAFREAFPRYAETSAVDELRRSDFARLDTDGHVYLDYTGAGLYADSQLEEHFELLKRSVFGNPHSLSPT